MRKIFESLMIVIVVLSVVIFTNSSFAEETIKEAEYYLRGPINLRGSQIPAEARLTIKIDGDSYLLIDGEDRKPLNDKPDYASVKKNDRRRLLRGERTVEPKYGDLYREERDKLVGEYVEKFKAIVSGKVKGEVDIHQNPIPLSGDIRVDIVAQDGTRYFAMDEKGDGSTEYFQTKKKGSKDYVILIEKNTSPGVQKLIGDLIEFTLNF